MATGAEIQDAFLDEIREANIKVTVYLTNGVQLRGTIKAFDDFTVLLESSGQEMMIYKHALSTIAPRLSVHDRINDNDGQVQQEQAKFI